MWNSILDFAGWALFYLWIILYVRWVLLERAYFAGENVEDEMAGVVSDDAFPEIRDAHSVMMFPFRPSLRRPA